VRPQCRFCPNEADYWIKKTYDDPNPPTPICEECLQLTVDDPETGGIVTPMPHEEDDQDA